MDKPLYYDLPRYSWNTDFKATDLKASVERSNGSLLTLYYQADNHSNVDCK